MRHLTTIAMVGFERVDFVRGGLTKTFFRTRECEQCEDAVTIFTIIVLKREQCKGANFFAQNFIFKIFTFQHNWKTEIFHVPFYTDKYFRNLVDANQIWIVITFFR